jgi:hypothetical protein
MDARWPQPRVLIRYCDDFVILCRTRQQAEQARRLVVEILATLGLHLHPDKTRIVGLTKAGRGSTSSASTITRWSPGAGEAAGTCNDGRPPAR